MYVLCTFKNIIINNTKNKINNIKKLSSLQQILTQKNKWKNYWCIQNHINQNYKKDDHIFGNIDPQQNKWTRRFSSYKWNKDKNKTFIAAIEKIQKKKIIFQSIMIIFWIYNMNDVMKIAINIK